METTDLHVLEGILTLLASAVVAAGLFRRMNLPAVIGYLVVGLVVGPHGLAFIKNTHTIHELAEFGVVFLMFTIGLEFSLAKLLSMKRLVLGLGGMQVVLTTFLTVELALYFGADVAAAMVIGGVVAMSSTAIVIKQLNDQLEINTSHGTNAVGILLFQDLAVIAFLILIPSLADKSGQSIYVPLMWALIKAIVVMIVILLSGRWILRPLFREIAQSKSMELFTITVLLVTLGAAWLTGAMGLSMALGSFLAGMMLAETQFRHQIEIEIRPFRDVLLGLFFVSIGMLLDVEVLPEIWMGVLILIIAVIVFKTILIAILCKFTGSDLNTSLRTGLILAQGGEFGFALLTLAISDQIISDKHSQLILATLFFSMAISPFLVRYNEKIAKLFMPKAAKMHDDVINNNVETNAEGLSQHIIICGFGRVGQNIARFLETEGFEFIALDMDPIRVEDAQLAGERVSYGDSGNIKVLDAAGLKRAKALILSFHDTHTSYKILHQVRKEHPDLPILVRTQDDTSLEELQKAGATEIVPETLEASLMLAFHSLVLLGVPANRALGQLRRIRKDRYQLLRQVFPSHDLEDLEDEAESNKEKLYVVSLAEQAAAITKTIKELDLAKLNVIITSLCRDGIRRPDPDPKTELKPGDVLVLYGKPNDLTKAENSLLGNKLGAT